MHHAFVKDTQEMICPRPEKGRDLTSLLRDWETEVLEDTHSENDEFDVAEWQALYHATVSAWTGLTTSRR